MHEISDLEAEFDRIIDRVFEQNLFLQDLRESHDKK